MSSSFKCVGIALLCALATPVFAGGSSAPVSTSLAADLLAENLATQAGVTESPTDTKDVEADLRQLLGRLESLRADFEQTVSDTDGHEIQTMNGEMVVARPGKIRWQTQPPFEQLLISDATTLWLYDKDLEQVTVRPFMRDIVNSPAMLFIGDLSELEAKYRVLRTSDERGQREFVLIPRDASTVYQKLSIRFDGNKPVSMALWDSLGQVTQVNFANVTLNPAVSSTLFQFDIPDGVDVLYND